VTGAPGQSQGGREQRAEHIDTVLRAGGGQPDQLHQRLDACLPLGGGVGHLGPTDGRHGGVVAGYLDVDVVPDSCRAHAARRGGHDHVPRAVGDPPGRDVADPFGSLLMPELRQAVPQPGDVHSRWRHVDRCAGRGLQQVDIQ